jgi:hypothetical protein
MMEQLVAIIATIPRRTTKKRTISDHRIWSEKFGELLMA